MVTESVRGVLRDFGFSRVTSSLGRGVSPTFWRQETAAGYQAKELYVEDSKPTPMSDVYAFGGVILAVSFRNIEYTVDIDYMRPAGHERKGTILSICGPTKTRHRTQNLQQRHATSR